jgi:tetratricopeptide (TPR) repeat protein
MPVNTDRRFHRATTVLGLLALIGAACSDRVTKTEPPASEMAPQKSEGGDCLATVADAQLAQAQHNAQAAVDRERAAAWVSVGRAFVRLARTDTRPELYRNVEACAARALAVAPSDADALHLRGIVMMDAHQFAEARSLAQQLIERDADDIGAWGLLSDASLELGAISDATTAAQRMLDLKPSLLSYGRAAHLRFLAGDAAGALELYGLAIAAGRHLKDREPSAWMMVQAALVFLDEGDDAGAEAGFDAALREIPSYEPALAGQRQVAQARAGTFGSDSIKASL